MHTPLIILMWVLVVFSGVVALEFLTDVSCWIAERGQVRKHGRQKRAAEVAVWADWRKRRRIVDDGLLEARAGLSRAKEAMRRADQRAEAQFTEYLTATAVAKRTAAPGPDDTPTQRLDLSGLTPAGRGAHRPA